MSIRLGVAILATVATLALPSVAAAGHTPVFDWGSPAPGPGNAPGEVSNPSGIDTDALDNVYVADYANNRVQKFTSDGELITSWGTNGAVSGFNQPVDVAVTASGALYVADRANNRIVRFDAQGGLLGQWTVPGPRAVATDGTNVFVADPADDLVLKFDTAGSPSIPASFGTGPSEYTGLDVTGTTLLVTDEANDEVERWTTGGVPIDSWGAGTLDGPSDIAVTEDGSNVFVSDGFNNRVLAFTLGGTSLPAHTLGAGNGTLTNPQGVATGSLNAVFVSDTDGTPSRIVKYSGAPSGSTVRVSGTRIVFEGDGSGSIATVTLSGSEYTFTELGDLDGVTRGAGCTQIGTTSVKCDAAGLGIQSLRFLMGGGNDTLTVNPTTPTTIDGGTGDDTITGSLGSNDTVSYASAAGPVTVTLATPGLPQNTVNAGDDTLTDIENLTGSGFGDTLTGDAGTNTLAGGAGTDRASYAGASARVKVDLSISGAQNTEGAGSDTLSSIENLTGSPHDDVLTGSSATNDVRGGDGDDSINVADAGTDHADCGGGDTDTATVDAQDTTSGCETVTIAGGGGGSGGGGGTTPTAPGAGGGGGTTPLVLSGLGASKMRSGKSGSFRYTLTLAARVTLTIARPGPGRKVGSSCKKQTRKNRKKRRCAFYSAIAKLTHAGRAGANTVPFSGKVKGRAMKRGTYRLTAVAVSPSGAKSASVSTTFKVTR